MMFGKLLDQNIMDVQDDLSMVHSSSKPKETISLW